MFYLVHQYEDFGDIIFPEIIHKGDTQEELIDIIKSDNSIVDYKIEKYPSISSIRIIVEFDNSVDEYFIIKGD